VRNLRNQLEASKTSAQDAQSKSQVLRELLGANQKKKLAGIHGRLGDLGTIDSQYDTAISTACGALNHIVVDTTSNAEKAVDYLRKNSLGVATFLILEKMEYLHEQIKSKFMPPESSQVIFHLFESQSISRDLQVDF
jgi:structural maintenance of chromosome 4